MVWNSGSDSFVQLGQMEADVSSWRFPEITSDWEKHSFPRDSSMKAVGVEDSHPNNQLLTMLSFAVTYQVITDPLCSHQKSEGALLTQNLVLGGLAVC